MKIFKNIFKGFIERSDNSNSVEFEEKSKALNKPVESDLNKYEKFFCELISFSVNYNISKSENFKGASEGEIKEFSKLLNLDFGQAIHAFLKYCGNRNYFSHCSYTPHTIDSIKDIYKEAITLNLKNRIETTTIVETRLTEYNLDKPFKLNESLLIGYLAENSYFTFAHLKDENPCIYGYDFDDCIDDHGHTFTNHFRHYLFLSVYFYIQKNKSLIKNCSSSITIKHGISREVDKNYIRLNNISWAHYYIENDVSWNDIACYRDEFYELMAEEEKISGILLKINDFEEKFIEFIEKKFDMEL